VGRDRRKTALDLFPVEQSTRTEAVASHIVDLERRIAGLSDELTRATPLAEIGLSTAALVHELSNALTPVIGAASLARRFPTDAACVEQSLERIERCATRAQRLCRSLLATAASPRSPGETSVRAFLVELRDESALAAAEAGVSLRIAPMPPHEDVDRLVGIARDELIQIGLNLVLNAVRAMSSRPEPRVIFVTSHWSEGLCTLRFTDTGPGIPDAIQSKLFQPWAAGHAGGHGLGLWLSRRLAEKWGGCLDLEATSEAGATFALTLPSKA